MRVRITRTISGPWRGVDLPRRGQTIELNDGLARQLVDDGIGVPDDKSRDENVETATKPTDDVERRQGLTKASMRGDDEPSGQGPASAEPDASTVRAWATEQGFDVPARGRLPQALYDAYTAAHEPSSGDAGDGKE